MKYLFELSNVEEMNHLAVSCILRVPVFQYFHRI